MAPRVIIRSLVTLAVCACLPFAYAHDAAEEPDCDADGTDGELRAVYEFVLAFMARERTLERRILGRLSER